jgi:hypothetical protein
MASDIVEVERRLGSIAEQVGANSGFKPSAAFWTGSASMTRKPAASRAIGPTSIRRTRGSGRSNTPGFWTNWSASSAHSEAELMGSILMH